MIGAKGLALPSLTMSKTMSFFSVLHLQELDQERRSEPNSVRTESCSDEELGDRYLQGGESVQRVARQLQPAEMEEETTRGGGGGRLPFVLRRLLEDFRGGSTGGGLSDSRGLIGGEAKVEERVELMRFVKNEALFEQVGNVRMVVKSNLVTYRGPTMVSNTLHAIAILLKEGGDWDWFINLSASDYPLVTQDDMLHTLSTIPRDLNFIEHTSDIGWKEYQRAKPVIIDPGLYSSQKSDIFWITEKRKVPTAFKLFTGSAWMMLSRSFLEFCLWGWDNLPRIVLMYYANFLSSPEGYFHTVICNVEEFRNTTVNHDLHFISWDNPPKQHPHFLSLDDYQRMVDSNAPFARKFGRNEATLDKIDSELLGRKSDGFVPGSWLDAKDTNGTYILANITELRPGPGAQRLRTLIDGLVMDKDFHAKHCI